MKSYNNKLINETSPYLQQHAHNPVQWFPWNKESLELAKKEHKPILLSIGYSACHWCHVMAHESFEDETIAAIMNTHFINIKVDREERPDLDKIYQTAHQLMLNRPGGWPLTLFLTPEDQMPFYAGTYFPPQARYQMPAFPDLLQQLSDFYHHNQDKVSASKNTLKQALKDYEQPHINEQDIINAEPFNIFREELRQAYDADNGGFGKAPKFPHFSSIESLMHYQHLTAQQDEIDTGGMEMILFSLKKMACGGVYDHIGGGMCRYSVDDYWMIPHFEKMLYDNGPLLSIYCNAWQLSKAGNDNYSVIFKRTVNETADWVIREMQSPEGGFYATLDADTEGREGKFYVWNRDEIKQILHEDEQLYPIFSVHYGLDRDSNFEGAWNLHIYKDRDELVQQFDLSSERIDSLLDKARSLIFQQREQRIKPARDEKILTSWNGLMIKGLAKAGRIFQNKQSDQSEYIDAAEKSINFIIKTLWVDNHLLANYKDGQAHLGAYLDDYAFLLDAILELLQSRWNTEYMLFAMQLADVLLMEFEDKENGGFFFTANNHESLIIRPKTFTDESIPSGNAVAAFALGRLGHILGNNKYIEAAERTIRCAWSRLISMPYGHASLLLALEDILIPPKIIILRGSEKTVKEWQSFCQNHYEPNQLCLAIDNTHNDLPEGLSERKIQNEGVAYICSGSQCSAPVYSLPELISTLS